MSCLVFIPTYLCAQLLTFLHSSSFYSPFLFLFSYYLLTVFIKSPEGRKKFLWWGKYLTMFQMTQFFSNLVHAVYCFFFSPYWFTGKVLQVTDMLILLALFGNFYTKKHGGAEGGKGKSSGAVKTKKD